MAAEEGTRVTKQEQVYQQIRERILSGVYVPGYRIVIDAVVGEFHVSSIPVREAIRRLEAEGLVEAEHDIHVLHGLSRRALDQIVDRRNHNGAAREPVLSDAD